MKVIKNIKLPDGETYEIGGGLDDKITNCITEIPQDIKLELNDRVLTLKAGSKVYVPNGFEADGTTPKFDEVVIESDLSVLADTYNHQEFMFYGNDTKTLARQNTNMVASGSSNVMGETSTYCYCYNTSENTFYVTSNGGVSWTKNNLSLPICIATKNNSLYTSIDQTFNGFGYIGSTVFVLPNVKGLIPNGRNTDGTLNNIEVETSKVATATITGSRTGTYSYVLGSNHNIYYGAGWYYDDKANYNRTADGNIALVLSQNPKLVLNASKIESFEIKLPFRAVDYSDLTSVVPTGTVISFAANSNPNGFILCNGSAVSRTTYASLFSVIGTTYGTGDGSTTFNLPNLTDKFIQGSGTAGTSKAAGLPNITGNLGGNYLDWCSNLTNGAFQVVSGGPCSSETGATDRYKVNFNASRSNAIYGKSSTVQPPALTMRYYIKY